MDSALPSIADGVDYPLDPRYVPLQRLQRLVSPSSSARRRSAAWWRCGWTTRLAAGLVLVPLWLVLVSAVAWQTRRWPAIAYRHASYRVDELGIEIRRGVYLARSDQRAALAGAAHRRVAGPARAPLRPGHAGHPHRRHGELRGDGRRTRPCGRGADPRPPAAAGSRRCRLSTGCIRRRSCSPWSAASRRSRCRRCCCSSRACGRLRPVARNGGGGWGPSRWVNSLTPRQHRAGELAGLAAALARPGDDRRRRRYPDVPRAATKAASWSSGPASSSAMSGTSHTAGSRTSTPRAP